MEEEFFYQAKNKINAKTPTAIILSGKSRGNISEKHYRHLYNRRHETSFPFS